MTRGHGTTSRDEDTPVLETPSSGRGFLGDATAHEPGRYAVLCEIARGGMGRVSRAYDSRLQREVALKEVLLDIAGARMHARLVAEARALARLSHPNVVAVYDVERRSDGSIVMVMEYVPGQTLLGWLETGVRSWGEIVDMFVAAGRGLWAAHAAGLLHRDFKPENVLVGHGVVKVTDFGLVKAEPSMTTERVDSSGSSEQQRTGLTRVGTVLGTPAYMAPEQHQGHPLTEAVDQYAFCVALWEALCGDKPFRARTHRDLLLKKQGGPPPWNNPAVPKRIVHAVVRGLSFEPWERWPTMAKLLSVLSADPSERRRRGALAVAATTGIGLAASGVWYSNQTERRRCREAAQQLVSNWDSNRRGALMEGLSSTGVPYAPAVAERTVAQIDSYTTRMIDMYATSCEATVVEDVQSPETMALRASCLEQSRQAVDSVLRVFAEPDEGIVQRAPQVVATLPALGDCEAESVLTSHDAVFAELQSPEVESVRAVLRDVHAESAAGRYDRVRRMLHEVRHRALSTGDRRLWARFLLQRGQLRFNLGNFEDAESDLRDMLSIGAEIKDAAVLQAAASQLMVLVGHHQHRTEEGLRYAELATSLQPTAVRDRAIGHEHLGIVLASMGQLEAAQAANRRALDLLEAEFGPNDLDAIGVRGNMAIVHRRQGKLREAADGQRKVLAAWEDNYGSEHPRVARARENLANVLSQLGEFEEARNQFERSLAVRVRLHPPGHFDIAQTHFNFGRLLGDMGALDEAEAHLRATLECYSQPEHPMVAYATSVLGEIVAKRGDLGRAQALHRHALDLAERLLPPKHEFFPFVRMNLAKTLCDQGKCTEALAMIGDTWKDRETWTMSARLRVELGFVVARALWRSSGRSDDKARARAVAREVLELAEGLEDFLSPGPAEIRTWLDHHAS